MPINYQKVQDQVRQFGENSLIRTREIGERRQTALALLQAHSLEIQALAEKVEKAAARNPGLRTAYPVDEPLAATFAAGAPPGFVSLLAADGSQINPDRHDQLEFCLINVGLVMMQIGSGQAPLTRIDSRLLDPQEVETENGVITEATLALKRDLSERYTLAEMARDLPAPVITLTDGPLELYWDQNPTSQFLQAFDQYLDALRMLAGLGATTAGYVDKPGSRLLVNLLEIALLPENELGSAGKRHPLGGLTDAALLSEILCNPGDRSALFGIRSIPADKFGGELALHFFYLNVGAPGSPNLVRVEVPAWVARSPQQLDALQAVLVAQCRSLGARPYPYVLHRAHEMALVRLEEKDRLRDMLVAELYRRGLSVGRKSNKQANKDLSGRTRYKR